MKMISYSLTGKFTSKKEVSLFAAICKVNTYIRNNPQSTIEVEIEPNFLMLVASDTDDGVSFKNEGEYEFGALQRFISTLMRGMDSTNQKDDTSLSAACSAIKTIYTKIALFAAFGLEREWNGMTVKKNTVSQIYDRLHAIAEKRGLVKKTKIASIPPDTSELERDFENVENAELAKVGSDTETEWSTIHRAANANSIYAPRSSEPSTGEVDIDWEDAPDSGMQHIVTAQPIASSSTDEADADRDDVPASQRPTLPSSTDEVDHTKDGDRPSIAA